MAQEQFVEGWTERIEQQLMNRAAGETVDSPIDMSALDDSNIELELFDASRHPIAIAGATGFIDKATSKVYYDPAPTDLLAAYSPIGARWKVTDTEGRVSFFPRGQIDQWKVRKP